MENTNNTTAKMMSHASALETWLSSVFANAPHLPQGGRKFITTISPWLSLIFGILSLIGLIGAGAIGMIFSPVILLAGGVKGIVFFITIIFGIISSVLSILSFNPLRQMKKKGWDLAFYAFIVSAISSLLSLITMYGGIGAIVGIIIGAYVLFEIRGEYH